MRRRMLKIVPAVVVSNFSSQFRSLFFDCLRFVLIVSWWLNVENYKICVRFQWRRSQTEEKERHSAKEKSDRSCARESRERGGGGATASRQFFRFTCRISCVKYAATRPRSSVKFPLCQSKKAQDAREAEAAERGGREGKWRRKSVERRSDGGVFVVVGLSCGS